MEIKLKIETLKKKTLNEIKKFVETGNVSQIQKMSSSLSEIEYISNQLSAMDARLTKIEEEIKLYHTEHDKKNLVSIPEINSKNKLTAKAKANNKRHEFLMLLKTKGIILEKHKGVIYKDVINDGLVGIAYSCDNGDSWFLGLPDLKYKLVVLLCDSEKEGLNVFIFPKDFYLLHLNNLSKSNNQLKFNIKKSFGNYQLYTKKGNVSIDDYLNNYGGFSKN